MDLGDLADAMPDTDAFGLDGALEMIYQERQFSMEGSRPNIPRWGYFCQISDSTTSFGSYSGAVPNEKITWGKLRASTPRYIIESDATIVAPLIFAKVLSW